MHHLDHGHTVLAVPVPELDDYVRARTRHYDAAYLADDPTFGQAHVTLLAPWRRDPSSSDLAKLAELFTSLEPFEYTVDTLNVFPDGIIHGLAEPAEPFVRMTTDLVKLFPDCPPYGGKFADIIPHVTLDAIGPDVDLDVVRRDLADLIPVHCLADEVQLQWWQAGRCHVQATWRLGVRVEEQIAR